MQELKIYAFQIIHYLFKPNRRKIPETEFNEIDK